MESFEEHYASMCDAIKKHLPGADMALIDRAVDYANQKHKVQKRKDGSPYIIHPLAVAQIVAEMGLDCDAILGALLHDCIEDTDASHEDIEKIFGPTVAELVEGVTKLTRANFSSSEQAQMENLRKMFMAMSKDIRVVLIKIADRLHNMRTMQYQTPEKQIQKCRETMDVYAPLAHRLGMQKIKWELEDTALRYLAPMEYNEIMSYLQAHKEKDEAFMRTIQDKITQRLTSVGIHNTTYGRIKHVYSIYRKMLAQGKTIDELYDIYAFRVIVDTIPDCYNVLGHVHDLFSLVPGRFKDYISTPKPNMYQSLHTTVIGSQGIPFEVQIRTWQMHETAEYGIAAHWKYKIGESDEESELESWLKTITDILKNPEPNAMDFLDTIKLNLFAMEIIVFTPKGDLMTLPKNATVLDVAYNVHTELGSHCIAGKVNHRLVPISYKLQSGDQVEVLTSDTQKPSPEWLNFVITAKAKTRLEAALKKERKKQMDKGEKVVQSLIDGHTPEESEKIINKLMTLFHFLSRNDLYYAIGSDKISINESLLKSLTKKQSPNILYKILPFVGKGKKQHGTQEPVKDSPKEKIDRKKVYVLRSDNGVKNYQVASCCNPIPGDDVIGYVDDNENVIVHKMDCDTAMRIKSSYGNRIVAAKWEESPLTATFLASVEVQGIDRMGILQELIHEISINMAINIRKLNIEAKEGLFVCELDVRVSDVGIVERLCKQVKKIKGVTSAARVK